VLPGGALLAASFALSCGGGPATFHIEHAKGASARPAAISILGVYKDGRMSPESWEELGGRLSQPFGGEPCEVGFGDKLRLADADRFAKVEQDAMSQGVTDELLDGFATDTDGDAIIVFHLFGRVPGKVEVMRAPPPMSRGRMGGGMMGRPAGMSGTSAQKSPDLALEMAASIFSVRDHKTIVEISMKYDGKSREEAINLFVEKIASELPRVTCKGWRFADKPLPVKEP
jgi:hypothetical protein